MLKCLHSAVIRNNILDFCEDSLRKKNTAHEDLVESHNGFDTHYVESIMLKNIREALDRQQCGYATQSDEIFLSSSAVLNLLGGVDELRDGSGNLNSSDKRILERTEPRRVCRRPFGLSNATILSTTEQAGVFRVR